jgi:hypothetical protein
MSSMCIHSNAVLAGRMGMGDGAEWERGFEMGQLTLSKGPAKMGIHNQAQRAAIPSKGFSCLNNSSYV